MALRIFSIAATCATLVPVLASAMPLTPVQSGGATRLVAEQTDPVGAHAAIAQAKERLAEMDATITVLQENADKVDGAARQQAHDAVAALRAIRETYHDEIDGVLAQGRQMTSDQLAMARTALAAPWTQFDHAVDQDVASIKLDAAQRKALVEARIRAEQAYWQSVITDLQASATNLTAEQRAAIDVRIAAVRARADAAQLRLTRLSHAGQTAWSALKQGFVNSRHIFDETYRTTQ